MSRRAHRAAALSGRVAALAALAATVTGCADEGNRLLVDLRTDMVAGVEFVGARVEVEPDDATGLVRARTSTIDRSADGLQGIRIARFVGLPDSPVRVRVTLLDQRGNSVIQRLVSVDVRGNVTTTAVVTRDCRGVSCHDAGAEACLGGRCMSARCTPEEPEYCAMPPECEADTDCGTEADCAAPRCVEGFCFYDPHHDRCDSDQWCNPDDGCVTLPVGLPTGDAGMSMDGGPGGGDPCPPGSEGAACDDGFDCTTGDTCDGAGRCTGRAQPDQCFTGSACVGTGLTHPLNPCRVCDSGSGWAAAPEGTTCGGFACDPSGVCRGTARQDTIEIDHVFAYSVSQLQLVRADVGVAADYFELNNGGSWFMDTASFVFRRGDDGVWRNSDETNRYDDRRVPLLAAGGRYIASGPADVGGFVHIYRDDGPGAVTQVAEVRPADDVPDWTAAGYWMDLPGSDPRWLFVGLPGQAVDGVSAAGTLVVYHRDDLDRWSHHATLTLPSATAGVRFGSSYAFDDSGPAPRIAVGALELFEGGGDAPLANAGAVYLFELSATDEWAAAGRVGPGDEASEGGRFGDRLALRGDTLVIRSDYGTLHTFREEGDTWVPVDRRSDSIDSGGSAVSGFGEGLALYQDLLLATGGGKLHVYTRDGAATWLPKAVIDEAGTLVSLEDGVASFGSARFLDLSTLTD